MREAAEVYPENGEVRYYYGLTLLNTGQPEQAIQEMKDAILRNPRLIAPRRHLASQYLANGRFEDAAIQLQGVLVIDPEDLFSLVTYAALLAEKQADFAAAGRHLEVAEQLAPGDPSVIDARAWVAHLSGDRNEARRIVEEGGSYYLSDALFEQRRKAILGGAP